MMLGFWLISQEELVSMFDEESFNRLVRDPSLYSDIVQERLENEAPLVPIADVMQSYDKNVALILKLAGSVVESEKTK
jgi:hypothetical protein